MNVHMPYFVAWFQQSLGWYYHLLFIRTIFPSTIIKWWNISCYTGKWTFKLFWKRYLLELEAVCGLCVPSQFAQIVRRFLITFFSRSLDRTGSPNPNAWSTRSSENNPPALCVWEQLKSLVCTISIDNLQQYLQNCVEK